MTKFLKPLDAAILAVSLFAITTALYLTGCATLNPGADPFVVRVEQTQSASGATFDMVLHVDQSDRGFFKTNAAAFHNFCEWLRTPMDYNGSNVARVIDMQLRVEDLKLAYKSAKNDGSSNALWLSWSVLSTAFTQASAWQQIVTTPTHP